MKNNGKAKANGHAQAADLPSGWAWATLDEIAEIIGGATVDKKRKPKDPVTLPYLRVANVQRGFLDLREIKQIVVDRGVAKALELRSGDVLLNEGGDKDKLGRGWVWRGQIEPCIHQNHVFRARMRSADLNPQYVSHYANTEGVSFFEKEGKQTTNLASVSMSSLKRLPIRLPPANEQARIVAKIDELFSDIEAGQKALERAALLVKHYRQSVQKAAVTGVLTKDWRAKNLARLKKEKKTGADLLADILVKRRAAWEAAELAKMIAKGKAPKDDKWKRKYVEPSAPEVKNLPELPDGWAWARLDAIADLTGGITVDKNLVQVDFYKHERIDAAYRLYMALLSRTPPGSGEPGFTRFYEEQEDALYDLLHEIGAELGYTYDKRDLRKLAYGPQGWENDEQQMRTSRGMLIEVLAGRRPIPVADWDKLAAAANKFPPPPKIEQAAKE